MFSFAIMMYEVLQRYIMLSAVAVRGTYEELEAYCARVAAGYRPPLHDKWPISVSKLIQVCMGLKTQPLQRLPVMLTFMGNALITIHCSATQCSKSHVLVVCSSKHTRNTSARDLC